MRHHAIIITSADQGAIEFAHKKAWRILKDEDHPRIPGFMPTKIIGPVGEGYYSFMIPPNGEDSSKFREAYVEWLRKVNREDLVMRPLDWVEVTFSADDRKASIDNHAWRR